MVQSGKNDKQQVATSILKTFPREKVRDALATRPNDIIVSAATCGYTYLKTNLTSYHVGWIWIVT